MEILYVHVRYPTGLEDMVPESTAQVRADAGDFEIVDPTPGRYRHIKPRVPLGSSASPKRTNKATRRVVANPAPDPGETEAEEATEK